MASMVSILLALLLAFNTSSPITPGNPGKSTGNVSTPEKSRLADFQKILPVVVESAPQNLHISIVLNPRNKLCVKVIQSVIGNNSLFHGRTYDPELRLYYYRNRYYHPALGRFLQRDPMGYEDSMNLYQAFGMNPANFTDPFGLLTQEQRRKVRLQVFRLLMSGNEGRKNAALDALQNYRAEFGALTPEDIVDIFGENDSILDATFVTMQDILNLGGAKIALGLEDLSTNYNIYTRDDFMGMDALALRWNTEGMIGSYNSVIGRISRMNRIRKASGSMESSYSFLNPTINRSLSYIELTPENYEEILTEQMALEGQSKAAVFATTSVACNLAVRTNIIKARENFITNAKAKYPKQFEQYSELNANQLEKAINTHSKRIAEHELFIRDPKSHVPNWESLSPKHQNNLIYHWQQDILRHSAYKAIAEAILETR